MFSGFTRGRWQNRQVAKLDKLIVQRFHKGKMAKQDKLLSGFTTDRVTASQRSGETGQTPNSAVSQ